MGADRLRFTLERYRVPFVRPLRTAAGVLTHREGLFVLLSDGEHTGVGEAAPLPGFSRETLEQAREALQGWLPGEELPTIPSARHGIEHALLALEGARSGRSLAQVLSDPPRERVPVNRLITGPEDARQAVDEGFACLKLKVGLDVDEDVTRARAVREAVGPEILLRLDANRGWTEAEAREAIDRLAPLGIELLEEPTRDLQAMARLRGPIPLAADESVRDEDDLRRVIEVGAADVVVLKPMLVGGPLATLSLLDLATEQGLRVVITTSFEAAPGREAALAVAAARQTLPCGLDTGRWLQSEPRPTHIFQIGKGHAIPTPAPNLRSAR